MDHLLGNLSWTGVLVLTLLWLQTVALTLLWHGTKVEGFALAIAFFWQWQNLGCGASSCSTSQCRLYSLSKSFHHTRSFQSWLQLSTRYVLSLYGTCYQSALQGKTGPTIWESLWFWYWTKFCKSRTAHRLGGRLKVFAHGGAFPSLLWGQLGGLQAMVPPVQCATSCEVIVVSSFPEIWSSLAGKLHQVKLSKENWTDDWLVASTPLKNISQLGWLFPIYGKKHPCSKPPTRWCCVGDGSQQFFGKNPLPELPSANSQELCDFGGVAMSYDKVERREGKNALRHCKLKLSASVHSIILVRL